MLIIIFFALSLLAFLSLYHKNKIFKFFFKKKYIFSYGIATLRSQ